MGAMKSALTSCRASRVDLRGDGFAVDKFGCAFCVGRGGKHCSVISSQHFQPGCHIGCVILARFQSKLQIGAQERGPEFSYQFLDSVMLATGSKVAVGRSYTPQSQLSTFTARTAMPVPAATPARAFFAPGSPCAKP